MIAPIDQWRRNGEWQRISLCGRYCIQKTRIGAEKAIRYYTYPQPSGRALGGPFETAMEAWQCAADDAAGSKVAA